MPTSVKEAPLEHERHATIPFSQWLQQHNEQLTRADSWWRRKNNHTAAQQIESGHSEGLIYVNPGIPEAQTVALYVIDRRPGHRRIHPEPAQGTVPHEARQILPAHTDVIAHVSTTDPDVDFTAIAGTVSDEYGVEPYKPNELPEEIQRQATNAARRVTRISPATRE